MKNFLDFLKVSKSYKDNLKGRKRKLDTGFSYAKMTEGLVEGAAETAPNFGAMKRYLASKIGQHWNTVLAEITQMCGHSKKGKLVCSNFKNMIWDDITKDVHGVYRTLNGQRWDYASICLKFYIQNGILCRVPGKMKNS